MTEQCLLERPQGKAAAPLSVAYTPISTLPDLRAAAQLAIQVEFTTVPAYLTALYSITDKGSAAYQALRSVVVEEMFHLNQAANILIGIGGQPKLTGSVVPVYPAYLPSASTTATPYVGLYRASQAVFRNVFMAIETPAPFTAPPQGSDYQTIGQLYKALSDGIERCVDQYGADKVFVENPAAEQRTDIYLGKFGGKAVKVTDLDSAQLGIQQIVQQGEGAVNPTHPLVPQQPYGAYEHYGARTDGTYGPILGTPYELSHYYKFLRVADAPDFPDTLPIVSNPRVSDFANATAVQAVKAFNIGYSVMLQSLEASFTKAGGAADSYFTLALPLMHNQLPTLANLVMQLPVFPDGDPTVGPNAAPTFEYVEDASFDDFLAALQALDKLLAGQGLPALLVAPVAPPAPPGPAPKHREALHGVIDGVRTLKSRSDATGLGL
ncbi:ferritin-like domain-containing protein [Azospirillum brasilense]|uniref:ferritin-like domain-containing protein n=1 Tax=Azospirillum brasilense TaxID=192 RepID=UPI000E0A408D|nr:ferritin-like protein [Azospirillum brasilense]